MYHLAIALVSSLFMTSSLLADSAITIPKPNHDDEKVEVPAQKGGDGVDPIVIKEAITGEDSILTPREVNAKYIGDKFKNDLKGKGDLIIKTAKENGIDPLFFTSILAFETGWGVSRNFNENHALYLGRKRHVFKSTEDALNGFARFLKETGKQTETIHGVVTAQTQAVKSEAEKYPANILSIMNSIQRKQNNE
ncbi:MAG: glucosaminidase domain-containing protein [Bdellovibrionota bacterium]